MKSNKLLIPDLYYSTFWNVDFEQLAQKGYLNLIIDVDNTISKGKSPVAEEKSAQTIAKLKNSHHHFNFCLVSNIIFGKKRKQRVQKIADALDVPYVTATFFNRKPKPWAFEQAMKIMQSKPENTAVIGDQVFTDVLGGNQLNLFTILVKPLGSDHWATNLLGFRKRERKLLAQLKMKPIK